VIDELIARIARSLDCQYIRKWLAEFGKIPEYSEVLRRFEDLFELI